MGFLTNYAINLARVAAGREPDRPLLYSYYLTHRCDLGCRYCSDGEGRRFKEEAVPELSTDEARRLITLLRRDGDTLDVTGGEPMIREDLEEILSHARSVRMRTVLNTKGVGLEDRPALLHLSDVLVLSIDSLDPARLAMMIGRPPEIAERILGAMRFALANRPRKTRVVLASVAAPENLDDVAGVMRFALHHGAGFQVSPQIIGKTVHPQLRDNPRYQALVADTLRAKRRQRGVLGVPQYFHGIAGFGRFRCHPMLMPVIRPDGRLYYPCLESKDSEVSVLEAGGYRAAVREARRRRGPIPPCGDCCHLFCHMALSMFQRHPLSAAGELRHWKT
jgi:MoaA/NifB/PqqE/SkfB family radical SAM enzyme